jgi:hypothetical protein
MTSDPLFKRAIDFIFVLLLLPILVIPMLLFVFEGYIEGGCALHYNDQSGQTSKAQPPSM